VGDRLARFKVPRYLHIVDGFDDIGVTASAKVRKTSLAKHAERLLRSDAVR
jgi:fatty-acyl-CoA synthase